MYERMLNGANIEPQAILSFNLSHEANSVGILEVRKYVPLEFAGEMVECKSCKTAIHTDSINKVSSYSTTSSDWKIRVYCKDCYDRINNYLDSIFAG